jgi:hypothetical protein
MGSVLGAAGEGGDDSSQGAEERKINLLYTGVSGGCQTCFLVGAGWFTIVSFRWYSHRAGFGSVVQGAVVCGRSHREGHR